MTIAIGLMCNDGIVVAADTQEGPGYAGGLKTRGVKISNVTSPAGGALAVAGAGLSAYLDSIKDKIVEAFVAEPRNGNPFKAPEVLEGTRSLEGRFEPIIEDFYTKHVLQPYERTGQHFELLIAAVRPLGGRSLWTTSQTALVPSKQLRPVAIGAGSSYALQMLTWHCPFVSMEETVLFASYVIYRVKKSVESCGEFTDITCLKNDGTISLVHASQTKLVEAQFERYSSLEANLLDYALGRKTKDDQQMQLALLRALHSIRENISTAPDKSSDEIDAVWKLWG